MSLYDPQYQIIDDVIGDLRCIKHEHPSRRWTLRPSHSPEGVTNVRVMVGWNAEIIVVPVTGLHGEPQLVNAVTIGRGLPTHVTMNLLSAAIGEFFAAVEHGEEVIA